MKYMKSRVIGAVIFILAAALLLTGAFARVADQEGTPLNGLYTRTQSEQSARNRVESALTDAEDAVARAIKRADEAVSESEAALEAAEEALAVYEAGDYDAETDAGALGQSIMDALEAGEDVSEILTYFSAVYNEELATTLDDTKTTVSRAESACEDAVTALETLASAIAKLDESVDVGELPTFTAAEVPKLGDLIGIERLLTRAQNYITRSQAASEGAAEIQAASETIFAAAEEAIAANPLTATAKFMNFARDRSLDLMVLGGILLIVSLILLAVPGWLAARWKQPLFRKGFWFVFIVALLAAALHYADGEIWDLMREGVFDTLYMTLPSTFFAYVVGLPLGVVLVITSPGNIRPNPTVNSVLGTIVNFLRSIPFIILLVMLFDVTRFVMGSAIGTRAVIFPLFVSAFPYVARIVEGSLNEVDRGVIEAAESMGSSTWQIICKVLIPESLPSLINGAAICMTTILAYTAMAGSAGGDGLGKIAITYGLNYREYDVMYISSLLLVALVQIIQIAGGILMRAFDHRRK